MNDLMPLGATARYECAMCQHSFDIRSNWHIAVLVAGLTVLLLGMDRLRTESVLTQAFVGLVMLYMAYAIAENTWNRLKNPVAAVADEA